ncbi:outer-membrane lipoprotein carrier protein [Luteitalea sp. TBR-22]|uniref:outer membrane lipoprotein chaperone LolA n=1 Tax=Luteitalea sp. TBR-22 TaxID=2802971 RepID=UPI001AF3A37A|nr:outer membrane lipoprotein chaperone LolA [Luteitalea sp. TBR-22]BCS33873.1 outer-membrane lipoprotein carrier protein [Luteitalea sp. TBR-22]
MHTRRFFLSAACLGLATIAGPAEVLAQGTGDALARSIQAHYQQVKDFTAAFEQSYVGGALKRRTVERGTVAIRKPGRMRWDYEAPEKKLFVADGMRMYFYVPADRQVRVSAMPEAGRVPTPILFLAGRGDLLRDFTVEEVQAPMVGTRALKLRPVRKEPEYETLTLVVDATTFVMRQLIVVDGQGGTSTFSFTNLRENVGVAEGKFRFSMPKGVDVVTQE